jgi:hypothetical protein
VNEGDLEFQLSCREVGVGCGGRSYVHAARGKDHAFHGTNGGVQMKTADERATRDVLRWRRDQLTHAGFPKPLAAALAGDARYDLHALIQLVERCCAPELATRILAPLDIDRSST